MFLIINWLVQVSLPHGIMNKKIQMERVPAFLLHQLLTFLLFVMWLDWAVGQCRPLEDFAECCVDRSLLMLKCMTEITFPFYYSDSAIITWVRFRRKTIFKKFKGRFWKLLCNSFAEKQYAMVAMANVTYVGVVIRLQGYVQGETDKCDILKYGILRCAG